jgi:hypothetical protein
MEKIYTILLETVIGFRTKGSRKLRFTIFVRFKCRTGIFNYVTVEFLILQFLFGHPLDTVVGCIESWRGILELNWTNIPNIRWK